MPERGKLLLIVVCLALLVQESKGDCSLKGCSSCQFNLVSGQYVQFCLSCNTGFTVDETKGICNFNIGLVVGVSVGAVLIIVFQISLFCLCQAYFKNKYRKRSQFTLDQIFNELQQQRNDPDVKKQLQKKYQPFLAKSTPCRYCVSNPEDKLTFPGYDKNLKEWEKKKADKSRREHDPASNEIIESAQQDEQQELEDPTIPTLETACKCYYHLPCLKKQLKNKPEVACICKKTTLVPFKMICVICRIKDRMLNFDITVPGNMQTVEDYVCAICYKKKLDKLQKKKSSKKHL